MFSSRLLSLRTRLVPGWTLYCLLIAFKVISAQVKKSQLSLNTTESTVHIKDPHPLGLSFEFFEFPTYLTLVGNTVRCMDVLESALANPLAVRIGGTTQDRTVYVPHLKIPIHNNFTRTSAVPANTFYGPEYFELVARLKGPTTIGINRKSNNFTNSILAIKQALVSLPNIYAIELGNEPDYWGKKSSIAKNGAWNAEIDAASQILWQRKISEITGRRGLIQSGVFLTGGQWSINNIAPKIRDGNTVDMVKSFGRHAYPQSACGRSKTSLPDLMSHASIVRFVNHFAAEVEAADSLKIPLHFSETNSATCGGGGVSSTFGAGLWLVDYVIQSLRLGAQRIYLHQGTIGQSPYSFWGHGKVFSPFYGAYFVSLALSRAQHFKVLKTSVGTQAAYAFYRGESLLRILIYNSEYYSPASSKKTTKETPQTHSKSRPKQLVTLNDIPNKSSSVKVLRLTAKGASVEQKGGIGPSLGGATFLDTSCSLSSPLKYETIAIQDQAIQVPVGASEAVLIYFSA